MKLLIIQKITNFWRELYEVYIVERGKKLPFFAFIIFLLTILISRLIVIWVEADRPFLNFLRVSAYHIHHFYLGILLILLSNFLFLTRNRGRYVEETRLLSSVLFGAGLGLITDEFGLLLTMEFDVKGEYWAPHSYYLMGILSAVFLCIILFAGDRR